MLYSIFFHIFVPKLKLETLINLLSSTSKSSFDLFSSSGKKITINFGIPKLFIPLFILFNRIDIRNGFGFGFLFFPSNVRHNCVVVRHANSLKTTTYTVPNSITLTPTKNLMLQQWKIFQKS